MRNSRTLQSLLNGVTQYIFESIHDISIRAGKTKTLLYGNRRPIFLVARPHEGLQKLLCAHGDADLSYQKRF